MQKLDKFIKYIFWFGVAVLGVSFLVILGFGIGARPSGEEPAVSRLEMLRSIRTEAMSLAEPQILGSKFVLKSERLAELSAEKQLSQMKVSEFAMDLTEKLLSSTRKSDRHLTKPKAEALLQLLREELALPPNQKPDESIQAVRARLVSLTEMMVEVQASLANVEYEVEDVKVIVDQLPEILKNQRDHMQALDRSIETLVETTATKTEVQLIARELAAVKWATAAALGALFTVVGWIIAILLPKAKDLRELEPAH